MRVLAACESSGTFREAFRRLGHDAWSCDLLPADDGSAFHIQGDAVAAIQMGWDLVLACPPCTHLASSGARHFAAKRADGRQQQGIDLFMAIVGACQKHAKAWAVENPIGIMSRLYRKPDQIIQPWMFGHPETKATCLWLGGGLMPLVPTNNVHAEMLALPVAQRSRIHRMPPSKDRWKLRSKTFQGIADACASQWGTQ
jgi:hypothetical protein